MDIEKISFFGNISYSEIAVNKLNKMSKRTYIGCSGWSYEEWVGPFYPKSLDSKDFLNYYSKIFYTNEINTTFYNIPSKRIVKGWAIRTPDDFVFTAKIPRVITHENKLDLTECYHHLEVYLKVMEPLIQSGKLLAFLIQLPPSFNKDEHFSNLKEFINEWPIDYRDAPYNLAVEFRNESWMDEETFAYLRENALTYCAVIEPTLPPRMDITNQEFAYIRFHGFGERIWFDYLFSEQEIDKYGKLVEAVIDTAKIVGIYFNNHFSGYAPKNSLMMMDKLNIHPRNRPGDIDILEVKKDSGTVSKGQMSLDKFFKN
ncbi:MAG: DUF72 domain-containing protein [Candidatus Lokiarchaeota archaeon]|nr:DUF72 domain-containing protein [Candidatus Lokiarchaeota archaeon]